MTIFAYILTNIPESFSGKLVDINRSEFIAPSLGLKIF